MKWCSVKVNVRFPLINSYKVSNIFLCSCCFRPTTTWLSFRCWPTFINPFTDCFHWAKYQPFSGNFATVVWYPKPSFRNVLIWALSSYDILPIAKVIGLTAVMNCNIEEFWAYYNAMLHINIKIMTSQQRWYLLLSYSNNKINILFSCEIRSWSLRFRQFDICQVNTAHAIR